MKTTTHWLALPLAALAGACASTGSDAALAALPTPYTAEQIRDATPAGTTIAYRMVIGDGVSIQTMRFVTVDADGTTFETSTTAEDGTELAPTQTATAGWAELRDHAAFPLGAARTRATVTVPAGTYEVWRYTVPGDNGVTEVYDFGVDLPGPPVRVETRSGGEVLFSMQLLERT